MAGGRFPKLAAHQAICVGRIGGSAQTWNIDPVMVDGRILKRGGKLNR
jgi:hypothetical protein